MSPEDHALLVLFDERIASLLRDRRWYRTYCPVSLRAIYADLERETAVELHALLRLRRQARNTAREAEVARTNAIDAGIDRILEMGDTNGWDEREAERYA